MKKTPAHNYDSDEVLNDCRIELHGEKEWSLEVKFNADTMSAFLPEYFNKF
jgi:hypothetical protein